VDGVNVSRDGQSLEVSPLQVEPSAVERYGIQKVANLEWFLV